MQTFKLNIKPASVITQFVETSVLLRCLSNYMFVYRMPKKCEI